MADSLEILLKDYEWAKDDNILELQKLKQNGTKVVGMFCTFSPRELIYASNAVAVEICGSENSSINDAFELPTNICPLIKSSYGFAKNKKCPYFNASDLVVGETTCDGKKKMYEQLKEFKDVHILPLSFNKSNASIEFFKNSLKEFKHYLEEKFQTKIDENLLLEKIKLCNEERKLMCDIMDFGKAKPSIISGSSMHKILFGNSYILDLNERISILKQLKETLKEKLQKNKDKKDDNKKRILITGCPTGGVYQKIIDQIETLGGEVVAFENCLGYKKQNNLVETNGDLYENLAKRYLKIPCSIMSPNEDRIENLNKMTKEFKVDGIIDIVLIGCHTYSVESNLIKRNSLVPYAVINTDYSNNDSGQIATRIEAFLEMI